MTRVNLVKVEDLADQHLHAERREIRMVVPAAKRSLRSQTSAEIYDKICPHYTLNAGHVTFFYNKLNFLRYRFEKLTNELYQRGYNISPVEFVVEDYKFVYDAIPQIRWEPNKSEIQTNVGRITERLNQRPNWYRYYGVVKSPEFFIERYKRSKA